MAEQDPIIRRPITPATSDIITDMVSLWKDDTTKDLTIGRTYIKGPPSLLLYLGEEIENDAENAGDCAVENFIGSLSQRAMIRNTAIVARICMGRKLQGKHCDRPSVWREVLKK